jgi:tRNA modification GTPase
MLRLRHELAPHRASFGELIDPAGGDRIDEVVVTCFAKPHSYTTDDIVEISAHGAPVVLEHIVTMAIARGARLAEPGEFTLRAFLNGRLDLTQAEAVRDLIESQTLFQAKVAAQQLEGSLSRRLKPIKQKLVDLIAVLEAGVDFAEDDVAVLPGPEVLSRIAAVRAPLDELAQSFSYGKIIHEGLTLAIVGRPNVGKSSLFNRLVERERAIVTSTPGTTRDLVSETVSLGGIPVRLVDTAGLRAATDEAESIGIRKSYEALADADLVLVVLDATEVAKEGDLHHEGSALRDRLANRAAIFVQNKSDLGQGSTKASSNGQPLLRTSALTGEGIAELREAILKQISGSAAQHEGGMLTNARHQGLVLDSITGATTTDDILNLIFSSFCIGK